MNRRRIVVMGVYLALVVLFGGRYGLAVGAAVLFAVLSGLRSRYLWLSGAILMALAPFALLAQGLPTTPFAGPSFGQNHIWAHGLVGASLATVGWAGLAEATGIGEETVLKWMAWLWPSTTASSESDEPAPEDRSAP